MQVESLFPEGRGCFELSSSGWSRVLGIDAVGRPPHCDVADEAGARVASRWCPDWLGVTLAGAILDLVGEVRDQLGSCCQVGPPDRVALQRFRYAGKPRQRTWVGGPEFREAPVEDGGHVACGFEVASAGPCQHLPEGVLSSFGRQGEQMCPQE